MNRLKSLWSETGIGLVGTKSNIPFVGNYMTEDVRRGAFPGWTERVARFFNETNSKSLYFNNLNLTYMKIGGACETLAVKTVDCKQFLLPLVTGSEVICVADGELHLKHTKSHVITYFFYIYKLIHNKNKNAWEAMELTNFH